MKKNTRCTISVYFCARWQKWDISLKCTCIILICMSKTEVTATLQRSRKVVGLKYEVQRKADLFVIYCRGISDLFWLLLFVLVFLIKALVRKSACLSFSLCYLGIFCLFAPPVVHAKSSQVITILSLGLFSCSSYAPWSKLLGILLIVVPLSRLSLKLSKFSRFSPLHAYKALTIYI